MPVARVMDTGRPANPSTAPWQIGAVVFLGGIGGGLVFPILPSLGQQLGFSAAFIGFMVAANRITRLAANPVTGYVVDHFGSRLPLAIGLLIESAATFCYSVGLHTGNTALWFLGGRAVWGIGSSLLIVGSLALALRVARPDNRGRVTALVRAAMGMGMPAGLVTGGLIAGLWSDDAAFLTATALTLVAAGYALVSLRERQGASDEAVPAAEATGAGGAVRRESVGGRLAARWSAILEALHDPDLINRLVATVWTYNFLAFFTLQGVLLTTLVLVLEKRHLEIWGISGQGTAGVLMAVLIIFSSGTSLVVGRQLDRVRVRSTVVIPAALSTMVGFAILAFAHTIPIVSVSLIFLGMGMGGTSVPLLTLLGDATPDHVRGRAVGLYQVFGDGGGVLGPILGMDVAATYGYTVTYLGLVGVLLLALPFALVLYGAERRRLAAP